jgi:hypothetical protein
MEEFCYVKPCDGNPNDDRKIETVGTDHSIGAGFNNSNGSISVAVFPDGIKGGTISGLDTVFATPEPVSGFLLASGLFGLVLYGRKRLRSSSCLPMSS